MRKDFKGQTKHDERLRLLCQIRHEYTNYEKLVVFYSLYPKKRSELNGIINQLIQVGPDGVKHFRERVKEIEDYVNLNRRNAKRRFIKEETARIKDEHPNYANSIAKKCAETMLAKHIRENNERIKNHKGVYNDDSTINQ